MNWKITMSAAPRFTRAGRSAAVFLLLAVLPAPRLLAQSSSIPDGIVATGSSSVSVEPSALRLTMSVTAQGTSAKEAIQLLAAHKKRVTNELGQMNADTDSIEFASTRLVTADSEDPEQAQYMSMMRMMSQQMGQTNIDMDSVPTIYTATASLKVEWPLPTKDPNALALLPQGLKDQISERDFAGSKNKPKLDEESMEKLEAMKAMMEDNYGYSMDDTSSASPNIVFVGKTTNEARAEAIKSAIAKAKQTAEVIATAMDTSLGKLKTVWPTETGSSSYASYSPYSMAGMFSESDEESVEEVTAATADGLKLQIRVMAVYDFHDN